jgi:TolA-binding protein
MMRTPDEPSPQTPSLDVDARPAGPDEIQAFEDAVEMITALKHAEATEALRPLVERFAVAGLDRYAAESLFWLGYCSERLTNPAKSKEYYMRAVYGYPNTPAASQARSRLDSLGPE